MIIRKLTIYYVPVLIWMMVIFYFSSRHSVKVSNDYWIQFAIFKSLHLIEYAFLYLLSYRALFNTVKLKQKMLLLTALIFIVIYAATDEYHQSFVISREPALRDVIIDAVAGGFTAFYIWKLLPKTPQKLLKLATKLELV